MELSTNNIVILCVIALIILAAFYMLVRYTVDKKVGYEMKKFRKKIIRDINNLYARYNEDMYSQHMERKQKMAHLHNTDRRRQSQQKKKKYEDDDDSINDVGDMDQDDDY